MLEKIKKMHFRNSNSSLRVCYTLILISLLFFPLTIFSQKAKEKILIPYNNSTNWGFSNYNGKIIIECQYDFVNLFRNGYARIGIDDKQGLIDEVGNYKIKPIYDEVINFINGRAFVKSDSIWQCLDTNLNEIFKINVDKIGIFVHDLALIRKQSKYGVINRNGLLILSPEYEELIILKNTFRLKKENFWGVLNHNNDTLLPFEYDSLSSDNEEVIFTLNGNHFTLRDTSNQKISKYEFMDIGSFVDGLAPVKIDNKWGFIDKKGKIKIKPQFDAANYFLEDKAAVSKNYKWGYIDKKGRELTPIIYERAFNFNEDRATVASVSPGMRELTIKGEKVKLYSSDYEYYLINEKFEKIEMETYQYINHVFGGVAIFMEFNKQGLMDKNGKILVKAKYLEITPMKNNLYIVKRSSGNYRKPYFGYMNSDGFEYFKIE